MQQSSGRPPRMTYRACRCAPRAFFARLPRTLRDVEVAASAAPDLRRIAQASFEGKELGGHQCRPRQYDGRRSRHRLPNRPRQVHQPRVWISATCGHSGVSRRPTTPSKRRPQATLLPRQDRSHVGELPGPYLRTFARRVCRCCVAATRPPAKSGFHARSRSNAGRADDSLPLEGFSGRDERTYSPQLPQCELARERVTLGRVRSR